MFRALPLLLTLLLSLPITVSAAPPSGASRTLTASDAIAIAERGGGKAVNVQTVQTPQGKQYQVRVLERSGRVTTVTINAENSPRR